MIITNSISIPTKFPQSLTNALSHPLIFLINIVIKLKNMPIKFSQQLFTISINPTPLQPKIRHCIHAI